MRNIPDLICELVENDIAVSLHKDGWHVHGFYKSGHITLTPTVNDMGPESMYTATARYDERTSICSLHDLVGLNFDWWQRSKDRAPSWEQPDAMWVDLLVKEGFVEKQTVVQYVVK